MHIVILRILKFHQQNKSIPASKWKHIILKLKKNLTVNKNLPRLKSLSLSKFPIVKSNQYENKKKPSLVMAYILYKDCPRAWWPCPHTHFKPTISLVHREQKTIRWFFCCCCCFYFWQCNAVWRQRLPE